MKRCILTEIIYSFLILKHFSGFRAGLVLFRWSPGPAPICINWPGIPGLRLGGLSLPSWGLMSLISYLLMFLGFVLLVHITHFNGFQFFASLNLLLGFSVPWYTIMTFLLLIFQGDEVPPPFMSFEATGFPPELLREVWASAILLFFYLYAILDTSGMGFL